MQLRSLPLAAVVFHAGQGLEGGSLDLLEPLAAGDAKASVGLVVDALDADHQCTIDLGDRGKSGATEAEPEVAGEDFHQSLCDGLILGFSDARRNDGCGEVRSQVRIVFVQIGIVQMAFDDAGLQAIGDGDMGYPAVPLIHSPVSAEPVAAFHILRRPSKEQLAKAEPSLTRIRRPCGSVRS